jgi:hypothetical protein
MTAIRFFTDEDVYAAVAVALNQAGVDAISTPMSGRMSESDESQLLWASGQGRVVVTFNVGHFTAIHSRWMAQGRHHAGIVVSSQRSVGDVIRRLLSLAGKLDADAMRDRLEFLGDW